jgi:hypothetical protein
MLVIKNEGTNQQEIAKIQPKKRGRPRINKADEATAKEDAVKLQTTNREIVSLLKAYFREMERKVGRDPDLFDILSLSPQEIRAAANDLGLIWQDRTSLNPGKLLAPLKVAKRLKIQDLIERIEAADDGYDFTEFSTQPQEILDEAIAVLVNEGLACVEGEYLVYTGWDIDQVDVLLADGTLSMLSGLKKPKNLRSIANDWKNWLTDLDEIPETFEIAWKQFSVSLRVSRNFYFYLEEGMTVKWLESHLGKTQELTGIISSILPKDDILDQDEEAEVIPVPRFQHGRDLLCATDQTTIRIGRADVVDTGFLIDDPNVCQVSLLEYEPLDPPQKVFATTLKDAPMPATAIAQNGNNMTRIVYDNPHGLTQESSLPNGKVQPEEAYWMSYVLSEVDSLTELDQSTVEVCFLEVEKAGGNLNDFKKFLRTHQEELADEVLELLDGDAQPAVEQDLTWNNMDDPEHPTLDPALETEINTFLQALLAIPAALQSDGILAIYHKGISDALLKHKVGSRKQGTEIARTLVEAPSSSIADVIHSVIAPEPVKIYRVNGKVAEQYGPDLINFLDQLIDQQLTSEEIPELARAVKELFATTTATRNRKPRATAGSPRNGSKKEALIAYLKESPRTLEELVEFTQTAESAVKSALRYGLPNSGFVIHAVTRYGTLIPWWPTTERIQVEGVELAVNPAFQIFE